MNSRSSLGPKSASNSRNRWSTSSRIVSSIRIAAFIVAGSSSARRSASSSIGSIRPRSCRAASTTAVCFSASLYSSFRLGQCSLGRSVMMLSTMSSGEGSVGRVGPAGLADDHLHLGKSPQQRVAGLEIVGRLGHRRPRHRHRHVENAPFVQRRHVVHADLGEVVRRQRQGRERDKRQDLPLRAPR